MIPTGSRRVGVATVVGMLFMALVFMLAIGAEVYVTGAQGEAASAQDQARMRTLLKGQEQMSYAGSPGAPSVSNSGPVTAIVVAMVMELGNGTTFILNTTSSPPFRPASVPSGGAVLVRSLVPVGSCSRVGACLAVFQAIVGDSSTGGGLGLVTALGNVFWYFPSSDPVGGPDPTMLRTTSVESTSSTSYVPIPGLAFTGAPGGLYEVRVALGFWQSGPSPNSGMFSVGASNGTGFMFCGGTYWSTPTGAATDLSPGNACSSTPGLPLGPTWTGADSCTTGTLACEFTGTAYVSFGPSGGSFELEFEGTPSGAANVLADSVMMVTQTR